MKESSALADGNVENIYSGQTDAWLIATLIILVVIGYGSTLTFFFTADDLWQVHYAYRIFNGDTELAWRNFTGNYIQIPSFEFYRPLLGMTFWCDYLLGKTNPLIYHITSTLLYVADVVLLFGFMKRLIATFVTRDTLTVRASAFATAAMFAVSPLHCEAVTWLSGRADVLAAVFYLATLNMVLDGLNNQRHGLKHLALPCLTFILALGAKEIAIGLPFVIFALASLRPSSLDSSNGKSQSLSNSSSTNVLGGKRAQRFATLGFALKISLPFILIALLYLVFRLLMFGSMFGGYTGSFGLVKAKYASLLWFDPQVWLRIIFPFNHAMLKPLGVYEIALLVQLLLGSFVCVIQALLTRRIHWRLAAFLSLWTLTLLIPLATVWGLDPARHNSRLLFFLTMPLSAWLPCWTFTPVASWQTSADKTGWWRAIQTTASLLLTGMVALLLCATAISNQAWRTAGDIVNQVRLQCSELTAGLARDEKIMVLGIPDDYNGAMVILNGSTLHHLLSPPFCSRKVIEQVVSFKPFLIGPGDLIDSSRVKELLRHGTVKAVYAWNSETQKLECIPVSQSDVSDGNRLALESYESVEPGYYANLKLNPLNFDYLTFTLTSGSTKNKFAPITLWWNEETQNRSRGMIRLLPPPGKTPVVIGLSDNWRWYSTPVVNALRLRLGTLTFDALENPQLVSADLLMPSLEISTPARTTGEHVVKPDSVDISWNANAIERASKVVLEVTKPNFFFGGSEMIPVEKIIARKQTLQNQGSMRLSKTWFQKEGFYELRVHAYDTKAEPVGEFSQPATIYCSTSGTSAYLD